MATGDKCPMCGFKERDDKFCDCEYLPYIKNNEESIDEEN